MIPAYTIRVSAESADKNNIEEIVSNMSLKDKVTQMLMVDFRYWDENTSDSTAQTAFTEMNDQVRKIVEDYNFGAVVYFAQNITETEQSYNLTMEMQKAATKDGGIAMIIAADQEGGSVYRLGTGTALPGNMALGATYEANGTAYAYEAGKIIGSELSSIGINTTLAPVVDVNNNPNNPVIGLRSYSDDAVMVGELAAATLEGLNEYDVIGCAKHFPGHGDTETDSHYGLPKVDKTYEELKDVELKPYEIAIEQGIDMVMTAHILYPELEDDKIVSDKTGKAESLPATMSDDILTGLLKEEMGFEGIVITDAMNMAGISANWDQVQAVTVAIAAGVDMICMPVHLYSKDDLDSLDLVIQGVIQAVEDGDIPKSRIDDAVTRILTVKEKHGLLSWNSADYSLEAALKTVGSDANREMEREMAAAAVTVVRNDNNVLPMKITSDSKVLLLVPYNNERAQLLMAWNRAKEAGLISDGAQVDYYRFNSTTISTELQQKLDWADTYFIISEVSKTGNMGYASWLSAMPNKLCNYAETNDKTAIVASCDKPYDVQLYPNADAVLAAYGCKGSSVDPTEALVGGVTSSDAAYGPNIIAALEVALGTFNAQGKLPVEIPVYDSSSGTYTSKTLYERGYGLTYYAAVTCSDSHKYGTPEIVSEATCDTKGWEESVCSVCGYVLKEEVPSNGHAYSTDWTVDKAPTCAEEGEKSRHCTREDCDSRANITVIDKLDHDYTVEYQEPTCTEEGYEIYICKNCDEIGANYEKALGHAYSDQWTVDRQATCSKTGSKSHHCTREGCNAKTDVTEIPKTAHAYNSGVVTIEAAPGRDGQKIYTCQICKAQKSETIPYDGAIVTRIYGTSRYETSYAIADELKVELGVETFSTIIVANGLNYPDALAGSYLAAKKEAPILMVDTSRAENIADLQAYIKENADPNSVIYILGGTGAVSDAVKEGMTGYEFIRLFGQNRYDTNLAILEEAGVENEDILVCTGDNFADSLSASALGKPIFLVKPNGQLTASQKKFLYELKGNDIYIIGGTGAVSGTYDDALSVYDEDRTERIYGKSRYETSRRLAEKFCEDPSQAAVAYAWNFPDGLCGGPLAYASSAPLILTGANQAMGPDLTQEIEMTEANTAMLYIEENGIKKGSVLGGAGVLSDYTAKLVFGMNQKENLIDKKYRN